MNPKEINVKELFQLYSKDILNYSMSLLKDSDDAKDALQEVFVRFINTQNTFRGECSYKTWLLVITRNYCFKRLSGKKTNLIPIDDSFIEKIEPNLDEKISIEEAMRKLTEEEYELIYLREYACHSYKEMAEILGITIDNVKVKLFRIREQLRKHLK